MCLQHTACICKYIPSTDNQTIKPVPMLDHLGMVMSQLHVGRCGWEYSAKELLQPIWLQKQAPVEVDCYSTLQEAESSILAQQCPIKCLKGLVRNLLAVGRWGGPVLSLTLICDWGDFRASWGAWDNRKVLSLKHRHKHTFTFHTYKGITKIADLAYFVCGLDFSLKFTSNIFIGFYMLVQ